MNVSPWSIVALFGGVLAFLVGLPLMTAWVARQSWWQRLKARSVDPAEAVTDRFQLRPAEVSQVRAAVRRGRELTDPRLRAATVAWATALSEAAAGPADRSPRRSALVLAGGGLVAVTLGWLLAVRTDGRGLVTVALVGSVQGCFLWRQVRARDRAVRLNRDEPGGAPSGSGPDGDHAASDQRE